MKKILLLLFLPVVAFAQTQRWYEYPNAGSVGTTDEVLIYNGATNNATISQILTDANIPDGITITNAATADALSANGANCSAGQYPLGVDASGAVESCTADTDTQLSQEQVEDYSGGMFTGNTETRVTVTYQDGDGTVDVVVDDMNQTECASSSCDLHASTTIDGNTISTGSHTTDTNLTEEEVEDYIGGMVTGNTETNITVTYQDSDGTLDFVVSGGGASQLSDLSDVNTSTPTNRNVLVGDGVDFESRALVELDISDLSHTTDTNANTVCSGTDTYLDGEGNCDDFSSGTFGDGLDFSASTVSINLVDDGDGTTATTESESGFEFDGGELSLLRGCSDNQILKWDSTAEDWNCEADATGAGGSAITLDIGDDGGNDSTDVNEIATDNDTNNIVTEPSADKVLFDMAQNWPSSDTADALSANGANCSAGQYPLGVDASGAVEGCTADSDTQLTEEQVEDFIGAGVSGNTETRITVTYQDSDGTFDFVVDDMNDDVPESGDFGNAADLEADGSVSANAVALGTDTTGGYAASVSEGGPATTATALAANGANCSAGNYPLGVNASGAAESCTADSDTQLTEEQVEDFAGPMVATGGTKTGITVTYQDSTNDMDFVVDNATALGNLSGTNTGDESTATTSAEGVVELSTTAEATTGTATNRAVTPDALADSTFTDSIYWPAGALAADGTNCAVPASATINSGPVLYTIICTDSASSAFYGQVTMPDGYNGGTVTFELAAINTAADTNVLDFDFSAQCRGDSDAVNSTWGTAQNASITFSTANDIEHATTSAVTGNGTCTAGDTLFWRAVMDNAATTTAVATAHVVGVKMEYTTVRSD